MNIFKKKLMESEIQKAIVEVYGEERFEVLKPHMRGDGWINGREEHHSDHYPEDEIEFMKGVGNHYWRHKNLNGLEDNNGWVYIMIDTNLSDPTRQKRYMTGHLTYSTDGKKEFKIMNHSCHMIQVYFEFKKGIISHFREIEPVKEPFA